MHMADALISPAVGGALWAVSGGSIALCGRKIASTARKDLIPMMGVLGAFIFAAQMVNFSIPFTGSSGHLGGGLLLAILLGPHAAFMVIASVLFVQALFFADGGLLALGCNMFNLGFIPAFIGYPAYRLLSGGRRGTIRSTIATIIAAVISLQIGAFCVVVETSISGISELPFASFLLLMQPIHLAIGVVEGLATAAIVSFATRAGVWSFTESPFAAGIAGQRKAIAVLAATTIIIGGIVSWFASSNPDGLEWSIARITGNAEIRAPETGVHGRLAETQNRTAILPDYEFNRDKGSGKPEDEEENASGWPAADAGTSLAGITGGLMVLGITCLAGLILRCLPAGRQRCGMNKPGMTPGTGKP